MGTKRVYRDGTVKPPTIEDVRNRIAMARAHGDVAAHAVIREDAATALSATKNACEYWRETQNLLESYLEVHAKTNETKG